MNRSCKLIETYAGFAFQKEMEVIVKDGKKHNETVDESLSEQVDVLPSKKLVLCVRCFIARVYN